MTKKEVLADIDKEIKKLESLKAECSKGDPDYHYILGKIVAYAECGSMVACIMGGGD